MNGTQIQKINTISALFEMMALLEDVPCLQTLQEVAIMGLNCVSEIKDEEEDTEKA